MKRWLFGNVAAMALVMGGTALGQTSAPKLDCDTEVRQLRYLTHLYGQTRTEAEFEVARQRARADQAEAEVARLVEAAKATANPTWGRHLQGREP